MTWHFSSSPAALRAVLSAVASLLLALDPAGIVAAGSPPSAGPGAPAPGSARIASSPLPRLGVAPKSAPPSGFTYQGQLRNGLGVVSGPCDLQFSLFDAPAAGAQVGTTQTRLGVTVDNGVLTVQLDFGAGAFQGDARWLEIAVRSPSGGGSYTTLTPRQAVTAAPQALTLRPGAQIRTASEPIGLTVSASDVAWVAPVGVMATGGTSTNTFPGQPTGVFGESANGTGLLGYSQNGIAIVGQSDLNDGVQGISQGSNGVSGFSAKVGASGVYGENSAGGYGVAGRASGSGIGVFGENFDSNGWAGRFNGRTLMSGDQTVLGNQIITFDQSIAGSQDVAGGQTVSGPLSAMSDVSVGGNQSFGSVTRQMLNLWGTQYGVGVQNATFYSRSGGAYAWYQGGTHSNSPNDPGLGGIPLMNLSASGRLSTLSGMTGGTPTPGQSGVSGSNTAAFDASFGSAGVLGTSTQNVGVIAQSSNFRPFMAFGSNLLDPKFYIENNGNVRADGTFSSPAADFAEMMPAGEVLEPGDVLAIGADGALVRSRAPYQRSVVGVYSTKPAFLGGSQEGGRTAGQVPLAVVGIVPVKVTASNGPIRPGDLLVASSSPGRAMRADDAPSIGSVIGKALQRLDDGAGTIQVVIMLQ
jgi:hypothetical protein